MGWKSAHWKRLLSILLSLFRYLTYAIFCLLFMVSPFEFSLSLIFVFFAPRAAQLLHGWSLRAFSGARRFGLTSLFSWISPHTHSYFPSFLTFCPVPDIWFRFSVVLFALFSAFLFNVLLKKMEMLVIIVCFILHSAWNNGVRSRGICLFHCSFERSILHCWLPCLSGCF